MIDFLIIGAGIVGSWIGYEAARRGHKVVITDRSPVWDTQGSITAHSTGILHSGIYYPPGSEKARHSIRGRNLTIDFVKKHNIPYNICGKLITGGDFLDARTTEERIISLYENGTENGFKDLRIIKYPGQNYERVKGSLALLVPQSGIVDTGRYLQILRKQAENKGALFLPGRIFTEGYSGMGVLEYDGNREEVPARFIINSAGLESDHVAELFGITDFTIRPVKSQYYKLSHKMPQDILIYPLLSEDGLIPDVHYVFHLNGDAFAGPGATESDSRSDYQITMGRSEFWKSLNRIVEGYSEEDLTPGYAGIRPTLFQNNLPVRDFIVMERPSGVMHLLGIESPGLTSAPSLAMDVIDFLTAV